MNCRCREIFLFESSKYVPSPIIGNTNSIFKKEIKRIYVYLNVYIGKLSLKEMKIPIRGISEIINVKIFSFADDKYLE